MVIDPHTTTSTHYYSALFRQQCLSRCHATQIRRAPVTTANAAKQSIKQTVIRRGLSLPRPSRCMTLTVMPHMLETGMLDHRRARIAMP